MGPIEPEKNSNLSASKDAVMLDPKGSGGKREDAERVGKESLTPDPKKKRVAASNINSLVSAAGQSRRDQ